MNGLKGKSKRLAEDMLRSTKFRVAWNIKKIDAEMDTQNDQNRNQQRFEIRFLRFTSKLRGMQKLDRFGKQFWTKNLRQIRKLAVRKTKEDTFGLGRQKRRIGPRLCTLSVLEFWFGTLRPPRVCGGSMGYRLFRRPPKIYLCVWVFGLWVCGFVSCVF